MRAVNLIPRESRPGSGSPIGAPALLGGLGLLVVAAALFVLAGNSVSSKTAELSRIEAQTRAAETQSAALAPYRTFAALEQSRVSTVTQLASSRFDWERALDDLSRVLPTNVWLTGATGTVAPGVAVGSQSNTAAMRSQVTGPALELTGCTESQSDVARLLTRLRLMNGVTRVSLAASEKAEGAGAGAGVSGPGGASGDCRNGSARFPQFQLVIFFEPVGGTAAAGTSSAAQTTVPTSTPATGGGAK